MSIPVPRREASITVVTRMLIDHFESEHLVPGQKLPSERALCERLGVGRSTLREAMKSLELLGLVDQRVGDGTYLAQSGSALLPSVVSWGIMLDEPKTDDALDMRKLVVVQAAEWAAARRAPAQLTQMHDFLEQLSAARTDPGRFAETDSAFHRYLGEVSGNTILAGTVTRIHALLLAWTTRAIDVDQTLSEYRLLLKAIDAADPAEAREVMAGHADRVAAAVRVLVRESRREAREPT